MTTDPQDTQTAACIQHYAAWRREALVNADRKRSSAYGDANRAFIDAVRPIIDAGTMTVAEVAEAAEIGRIRMYQLLRAYPPVSA